MPCVASFLGTNTSPANLPVPVLGRYLRRHRLSSVRHELVPCRCGDCPAEPRLAARRITLGTCLKISIVETPPPPTNPCTSATIGCGSESSPSPPAVMLRYSGTTPVPPTQGLSGWVLVCFIMGTDISNASFFLPLVTDGPASNELAILGAHASPEAQSPTD